MALDALLFEDGLVCLRIPEGVVLGIGVRALPGVFSALLGLPDEIGLAILAGGVSTLFEEVSGEVVGVLVTGGRVETEQSEFDLGVAGVPVDLVLGGPEGLADETDVLEDWLQEEVVLVIVMVCQGSFDQVASVVPVEVCENLILNFTMLVVAQNLQLVHIPEVCPALLRGNHLVMQVQIPVVTLCLTDHLDNLLDCLVEFLVVLILEEVTRRFDPFPAVTVPEEMRRAWPDVRYAVHGMRVELEAVIAAGTLELPELGPECCLRNGVAADREHGLAVELGAPESRLRVRHVGLALGQWSDTWLGDGEEVGR